MLELETSLERVLPVTFAEVIGHLERSVDFIGRQEGIRPERVQAGDGNRRQAAVFRDLRHALNPKLTGNIGEIVALRAVSCGVDVSDSYPRLIYRAGRQAAGPAQNALLGEGGLNPLLESAAVGNPSERSWDELGVVHIAEAAKYLVSIVGAKVHPCVEAVAALGESRIGRLVVDNARSLRRWVKIKQLHRVRVKPAGWKLVERARSGARAEACKVLRAPYGGCPGRPEEGIADIAYRRSGAYAL